MKQIKVSVPATSANVGSGFDAVGLAVTLYNTATFEESDKLDISAADGTRIPRGESNLIYRSAKSLFDRVGKRMPPLRIVQTNPIPMARGLGSSSACIIAGLLGANRMLGDVLDTQELLTLATAIEGHPDNVAPALLGGLTTSVFEGGQVYSVKREVDPSLCFAAVVPDYKLLTEAARAALPGQIPHRDAVYNLSRAALLPHPPDARLERSVRPGKGVRGPGRLCVGGRQHRHGGGGAQRGGRILHQAGTGAGSPGGPGRM